MKHQLRLQNESSRKNLQIHQDNQGLPEPQTFCFKNCLFVRYDSASGYQRHSFFVDEAV